MFVLNISAIFGINYLKKVNLIFMPRTKTKGSDSVSVKKQKKISIKSSPSIKVVKPSSPVKKVQKGKMNIDTEQMIKDLVELGRINNSENKKTSSNKKKKSGNGVNPFFDLSNSPLVNFIQEKNHGASVKIAVGFLAIVTVFFASILYVANSKAVINIVLKRTDSTSQIQRTFNIYDLSELDKANHSAIVVSVPVEVSVDDSYAVSTRTIKTERAEGKIKITNNSNMAQGLVASTRFISDVSGDLYRLAETVNIPANSSIEARIYADKETYSGESAGVRFTIPGLRSDEMKKLIYGESISNINFEGVAKAIVTEDDISKANSALETKLRQLATNTLQNKLSNHNTFVLLNDSLNFQITNTSLNGVKVGSEVEGIKISGKAKASALFIDKNKILDVVKSNILSQNLSSNIVKIKESTLNYYLSKIDLVNKLASLNISIDSYVSYNIDQILDREDIAGMNINDFYIYAQDKGFASRVQVVSYPFWNKTLPRISDNIMIRVK